MRKILTKSAVAAALFTGFSTSALANCDTTEATFRNQIMTGDMRRERFRPFAKKLVELRASAKELAAMGREDACNEVMDAVRELASNPPATVGLAPVKDTGGKVQVSKIMNAELRSADDKYLGTINNIIIDGDGQPAYVVAEHGGFLGFGEEEVVIPFTSLQMSPASEAVFLPISARQFEEAPRFRRKAFDWQKDRSWQKQVDGYYNPITMKQGSQSAEKAQTSGTAKEPKAEQSNAKAGSETNTGADGNKEAETTQ